MQNKRNNHSLFFLCLGALFHWASLPPVGAWPLAFLVPVFWSFLIECPDEPIRFRTVYVISFVYWLATIWWIACPHPLTSVGLLALAGYLAVYWPLFFASTRTLVHRLRIPAVLAVPICWIGCEWLRNHVLGGFSFGSLEHALYRKPNLIQIADLGGQYFVGGMIFLVGTGAAAPFVKFWALKQDAVSPDEISGDFEPRNVVAPKFLGFGSALLAVMVLLATTGYGMLRLHSSLCPTGEGMFRLVSLQGNIPVSLNAPPEQAEKTLKQFIDLTWRSVREAREKGEKIDLIVWPETVCPISVLEFRDGAKPEDQGWTGEEADSWRMHLSRFAEQAGTPLLIGLSTGVFEGKKNPVRLNSALLVDPKSHAIGPRYDKVHLVMFGEYIPFSQYLPDNFFLKTLCQEAGRGTGPVAMPIRCNRFFQEDHHDSGSTEPFWASVNICFESTIPHLIRNQILTLEKQGKRPVLLINISNDGWFWFSSQIDLHLATHVFRAIENRRAYLTATNGGFSAILDSSGRIRSIGKRREAESVEIGDFFLRPDTPLYHHVGDAPAFACMILMLLGFMFRLGSRKEFAGKNESVA